MNPGHSSGTQPNTFLRPIETDWVNAVPHALGWRRLSLVWAKLEIVLGLSVAVVGARAWLGNTSLAWAGGILTVLGLYLAMAGHRSHLYQSMNRQTAYLLQMLERATATLRDG